MKSKSTRCLAANCWTARCIPARRTAAPQAGSARRRFAKLHARLLQASLRIEVSDFFSDFSGLIPIIDPSVRINDPNSPLNVIVCPSTKTPFSVSANRQ